MCDPLPSPPSPPHQVCADTPDCEYYTYYDTGLCMLFASCDLITDDGACDDCTTSQVDRGNPTNPVTCYICRVPL